VDRALDAFPDEDNRGSGRWQARGKPKAKLKLFACQSDRDAPDGRAGSIGAPSDVVFLPAFVCLLSAFQQLVLRESRTAAN
jgi:hypothetical protein